ncbi:MAG: TonB-dependent receptor [Bacteroidales bacterium]|nr:TonB-dependent receptor [Bacteroidales bacterium]
MSVVSFQLFAQRNFALKGSVIDAVTGEPLAGATVQVEGTFRGTATDLSGNFILDHIRNSSIVIRVSYISYNTTLIPVEFGEQSNKDVTVLLEGLTTDLAEVRVLGQTDGQTKALLDQRLAVNIKNVVSAEQIVKFPDMNAAEVMQRIPGITVQRDQGEGRYVQLRGTPPELTNFNINGEQIPSPEGGVRYVGLDVIAADQIEFIEVTKVLTPDMDADGIAGNVNIKTKTATSKEPLINASFAGGYNNLMKTDNEQFQFSYGQRVGKFGIQMNASYYNNNQGSHNMEYDYSRGPILSQAQSGNGEDNFYILYEDVELRHYTLNRRRTGLSASFDYRPDVRNYFYFRSMYNHFSDDEIRRRLSHGLSDANDLLEYRETGLHRDVRERIKHQKITTFNLGAEHQLFFGSTLDYEVSYAAANEEIPNYMFADFDQGGIDLIIDKIDPVWPRVVFRDEDDVDDAMNYSDYEMDELSLRQETISDINQTAKINFRLPYLITQQQGGYVKIGAKVRFKQKVRDNQAQVFNNYYQNMTLYSQTGPPLNLTTVSGEFEESNLLDRGYELFQMVDPDSMRAFYEQHPQHFKYDEQDTWEDTYQEDYSAREDIYAGYVMIRHDINRLMLMGGVRYERTDLFYTAQDAWTDFSDGVLKKKLKTDERIKSFLLPQFQLKYALDDRTNFRAALTYSYSRPNFDDLIPYRREKDNGDIDKGNPTLDYPYSMNVDLLAERYLASDGIVSGGFFYKKIDNFVFKFVRRAHEGENFNLFGLREITMAVNGIEAIVYGAEIQSQTKFTGLPGFLNNFGVYATYTFTESDAYISKRYPQNEKDVIFAFDEYQSDFFTDSDETEIIPLPGQAKHTANVALFYETSKLYCKISGNYHTEFLDELGNDSELDVYYDRSFHLDFTANYQITPGVNFFTDIINLTNAPLRYYLGTREYFKQQEFYSWWGRIGLKLNF